MSKSIFDNLFETFRAAESPIGDTGSARNHKDSTPCGPTHSDCEREEAVIEGRGEASAAAPDDLPAFERALRQLGANARIRAHRDYALEIDITTGANAFRRDGATSGELLVYSRAYSRSVLMDVIEWSGLSKEHWQ